MPAGGPHLDGSEAAGSRPAVGVPELEEVTAPGRVETIGSTGGTDREDLVDRLRSWALLRALPAVRRHPTAAACLLALLAAASAAVLLPLGRAVVTRLQGPQLPPGLQVSLEAGPSGDALWPTGGGARPGGPPVLPSTAGVAVSGSARPGLAVTGISGPGILRDDSPPTALAAGQQALAATVRPVLDCDRLPARATPGAYRVRLRVTSGGEHATRTVPVPAGSGWVEVAQQACRSWRGRRDLTVSALSAQVDPTSSRLTVTATVRNAGRYPAVVGPTPGVCCVATVRSGGALQVPAGGSASADWTASLDVCDPITPATGGAAPPLVDPMLSDELGLAGLAGPALPADLTGFESPAGPYVEQLQPLGVVLGRDAAAALTDALRRACGGLTQPVLQVTGGSTRLDLGRHLLEFDAVLDVSPGLVRAVRLRSDPGGPLTDVYLLTRPVLGPLRPDRSGQVRLRLSYRILDPGMRCLPYDGALPTLDLALEVPQARTVRIVRYTVALAVGTDRAAERLLCAGR